MRSKSSSSFLLKGLATLVAAGGLVSAARPASPQIDVGSAAPALFAEGTISTEDDEANGSFSADGTEYYFTKFNPYTTLPRWGVICVSRLAGGRWSEPEIVSFSGRYFDESPRVAPDGRRMYFTSSRPAPGSSAHVLRIWTVEATPAGWAEPRPLPAPVNAVGQDSNFSASATRDGTLYFASTRDGSGRTHIYRARPNGDGYAEPEKLGSAVNSQVSETDPFVSPDESLLFFVSQGDGPPTDKDRPETIKGGGVVYPRGDLYASVRRDGAWSPARHLEHGVNTFADETSPSLTPDGKLLFFSSERSPFTVPPSHRLEAAEITRMQHTTLNGHGNVYSIPVDVLGLDLEPPR